MTDQQFIAVDLFSGAGGMSLGAAMAGITVALAVDADIHATRTYSANHPRTTVLREDVRRLDKDVLRSIRTCGKSSILFGGPPCQGFSFSNVRTRTSGNPDNWLFMAFIRIARLWQPDWIVFENVKGITNTADGVFLREVVRGIEKLNYTTAYGLLNAKDFGVPQDRERFFLVARRGNRTPSLPLPTTQATPTVIDAIGDLPPLPNGATERWLPYRQMILSRYARQMRNGKQGCSNHLVSRNSLRVLERYLHIPQGGNWENIPARLMRNYTDRTRCHTGIYYRLRANEPSVVIGNFRKNMLIHPTQHRGLSVREAARIQSFPDDYEFHGSIGFQQQQVGNAVPPLLARAVFASLA